MKNRITERALACLNATNEAIIRSDYRDEAFSTVENTFARSRSQLVKYGPWPRMQPDFGSRQRKRENTLPGLTARLIRKRGSALLRNGLN
jgi:hypothetical protein